MTWIKGGIRGLLERIAFWLYMMSAMLAMDCLVLSLFFSQNHDLNPFLIFLTAISFGLIFWNLRYYGYKFWHFREHENIVDTDYALDFKTEEEYDRWMKMKTILKDVDTKDYKKLSPMEKHVIKQALEELIDKDDPTKQDNLD